MLKKYLLLLHLGWGGGPACCGTSFGCGVTAPVGCVTAAGCGGGGWGDGVVERLRERASWRFFLEGEAII